MYHERWCITMQIYLSELDLISKANDIKKSKEQLDQLLRNIDNELAMLSSNWEGEAQKSFFNNVNQMKPKLRAFNNELIKISDKMTYAARTMGEADRKASRYGK